MAEGLGKGMGVGEEQSGRREEEGGEGGSQLEGAGEGKWSTPVMKRKRLGGDSPPELLLEALGVEAGQLRSWLEMAMQEEAQCREFLEVSRRNVSQKAAGFIDKRVSKLMMIIKEMVAEYQGMERKVGKVVDRYTRVCTDMERMGERVEGVADRLDRKVDLWMKVWEDVEGRSENSWKSMEKRVEESVGKMVSKELEIYKRGVGRRVEELLHKMDILCEAVNKVHFGIEELPRELEKGRMRGVGRWMM